MTAYTYVTRPDGKLHAEAVPVTGLLHTPEGRPTPVKVDAQGNYHASTPEQLLVLAQLQDAPARPSAELAYQLATVNAQLATADVTPATDADALLSDMQALGIVNDAVTTPAAPPQTQAESEQRTAAAARLAAALGMQLVMVRDDPTLKVPAHMEIRAGGCTYAAGPLETIEARLTIDARQRAARDRAVALIEAKAAERARVQAEAIARSPAARLARLEAQNAELTARLAERV